MEMPRALMHLVRLVALLSLSLNPIGYSANCMQLMSRVVCRLQYSFVCRNAVNIVP